MSYGTGLVAAAKSFIKGLTPNRVTVYLTVAVNLTGAIYSVTATLTPTQQGGVVAALAGINATAIMFLKGWQKFEQANYEAQHLQLAHNARIEAAAQATAPRPATSKLNLPR